MNEDNLMSAKLLIDNFNHVKWHTIYDFYIELETELQCRGFEILHKPEEKDITNLVHGGPIKRKVDLELTVRKGNVPVWISAEFTDWLFWGVYNDKKIVSKEISSKIKSFIAENKVFTQEGIWLCWKYFGDSDEERICFPDFTEEGTFRLISPQYRKVMIQRLVNEMEAFINGVLKY
ncbi:hypothetical protein [uncultured Phocaeicola sp.]|uniref:hypothetical protein n=1 Tax=uncultured Phocaeicola sp. TaxID=990718 RepID=UPI0025D0E4A7|nr:hypothetical protein [uncultured Phocaeicola sp.]